MQEEKKELNIHAIAALYFLFFAVACFVHQEKRIFLFPSLDSKLVGRMVLDISIGAGIGLVLVLLSFILSKFVRMFRDLASEFDKLLGEISPETAFFLAAFSALGEEFFFRGLIQGFWGIVPASILFGLLHFGPNKKYLPWTFFALVAGFLFGGLYEWRGNLMAPVAAHFVVNFINLQLLKKVEKTPVQSEERES